MGNPVNKRVLLLKTQLGLTDIEFCSKASISTGTLQKIKEGGDVSPRVLNAIISNFGLNKEWLQTGKGEMYAPKEETSTDANPYRDYAIQRLEKEADTWKQKYEQVFSRLEFFLDRLPLGKLKPVRETALHATGT